jgi:hypothetical protein
MPASLRARAVVKCCSGCCRHSAIRFGGNDWWLEMNGQNPEGPRKFTVEDWREFGWAPDSKTFYLTQSEGFSTGYGVEVYRIEGGRIRRFPGIDRAVRRDFDRRHRCGDEDIGNDPNIAGLLWVKGTSELLVVAEVPPIGICRESEYFGGYLISVPDGRIITRYSPREIMARWPGLLGERLKSNLHYLSRKQQSMTP